MKLSLALALCFTTSSLGSSHARIHEKRELDDTNGGCQDGDEDGPSKYTYFIQARGGWTARDTSAVEEAGGEVFLYHETTGMALVTSFDPEFANNVDSFAFVAEDLAVDVGLEDGFHEQSVTFEDETFWPLQWNMRAIDAPGAWASGCDGNGARVAVIDGGISRNHIDIKPNLDETCSFSTYENLKYYQDVGGFRHSTHVAGIIAAPDNGVGTIGVAPSATIMAIKVLHDETGSFGRIIMGILYAADPQSFGTGCAQKADIINMSLGGLGQKRFLKGFHSYMNKAVNFAASQGVLVITAAGNEGLDFGQLQDFMSFPGTAGSAISVSATGPVGFANGATNFRDIASYTNYGEDLIDLSGPGGDFRNIPNNGWWYDMVMSPGAGMWGYYYSAGTSMAAPAVAGVAALIKGKNPDISLGALKAKLMSTADDEGKVGKDEFYGHGFVNARRACVE